MSFQAYLDARKKGDAATAKLIRDMSDLQVRLADRLVDLLLDLDVKGGNLVPSEKNIIKVQEIIDILKSEMIDDQWIKAVGDYVDSFDVMEGDILGYMRTLGKTDADLIAALKRHYKKQLIDFLTKPESFTATMWIPLSQKMTTAVSQGASAKELNQAAREVVKGKKEGDGPIEQDGGGIAKKSQVLYERSATSKIADELNIQFYFYQGRNIDTTRPFPCGEYAGHAWHRKEMEELGRIGRTKGWPGMVEGTDEQTIFVYMGGWFGKRDTCRHVPVPIAERDVPPADLARMREKGLLN